jgi:hypothetical protein
MPRGCHRRNGRLSVTSANTTSGITTSANTDSGITDDGEPAKHQSLDS